MAGSYSEWTLLEKRSDLSDGGLHLPFMKDGLLRFVLPEDFSASTAVTLGGARDDSVSDPRKIFTTLHVNWGRFSANQLQLVLADSDGIDSHLANFADEVIEHREVCRASDKAPHVPIAGSPAVSMSKGEGAAWPSVTR